MFENILETKKEYFGLDIGHATIKIIDLAKSGKDFSLRSHNEVPISPNAMGTSGISNKNELAQVIKKALETAKPRKIIAKAVCSALPETVVFSKVIKMPKMKGNDLAKAVPFEAAEFFPIPLSEMNLDWHVIDTQNNPEAKEMEILVIAVSKVLVKDYLEIFNLAGLELIALETKAIAAARAVLLPEEKDRYVLVDFGSEASSVCIVENGVVKNTGTIKTGGNAITRGLVTVLKIKPEEAEKIKKTSGIEPGKKDEKNLAVIRALFPIIEEVNNSIKYFQTRVEKDAKIKQIKIYGGAARLPNLTDYLQKNLNIPTVLANPWTRIKTRPSEAVPAQDALKYTTAIGLAMREL